MNCLASHAKVNTMKAAGFWFLEDEGRFRAQEGAFKLAVEGTSGAGKRRRSNRKIKGGSISKVAANVTFY
jgi:hypothetical protein